LINKFKELKESLIILNKIKEFSLYVVIILAFAKGVVLTIVQLPYYVRIYFLAFLMEL
jgi:hypothetical protein